MMPIACKYRREEKGRWVVTPRRDGKRRAGTYNAFLLRCWQEEESWRYSLEGIGHGNRQGTPRGFDNLPALLAALENDLTLLQKSEPSSQQPDTDNS
jgi:ATP-dependent DNA ligase